MKSTITVRQIGKAITSVIDGREWYVDFYTEDREYHVIEHLTYKQAQLIAKKLRED